MPPKQRQPDALSEEGLDFGWRVHQAIQEWTKSVDQKASIVLVFATTLAGVAATDILSKDGGLYATTGLKVWLVRLMGVFFAVSALSALSVVMPQLRRKRTRGESHDRLIFFGHLRHRSIRDIERALTHLDTSAAVRQLAAQLHVTSNIAWTKHARLQRALVCLVLATACYATARLAL